MSGVDIFSSLILLAIISMIIWFGVSRSYDAGEEEGIKKMQKEAIEKGAAFYHPTTGEFTWKEQGEGK
jgi:hypothetical protein